MQKRQLYLEFTDEKSLAKFLAVDSTLPITKSLFPLRAIDASETDTFSFLVVKDFDGVTIFDGDQPSSELGCIGWINEEKEQNN